MKPSPPHPARLEPDTLASQCRLEPTRTTGPGGQRRNKVATAVRLIHEPTGTVAQAGEHRHQQANRKTALRRLRLMLALNVRTQPTSEPSELWRSRTHGRQLAINPRHPDYPALLAEAMDVLHAADYDAPQAAHRLDVSTSQLIKLLKHEPAALAQLNTARQRRGEHPFK